MKTSRPGWMLATAASAALALMGCAGNASETLTQNGKRAPGSLTVLPPEKPATAAPAAAGGADTLANAPAARPASFDAWKADFRRRALAAGIAPATFDGAMAGVRLNRRVVELDNRQPEFSRPIWEYLDSAVSASRIATGQRQAARKRRALEEIERIYGVDYPIVLAIWGLESGFGSNFGSIPVVESLATLAYDGRRRAFGEEQLIAALRILQAGDITADRMVGSWAGAMGHTQFIPTSFLAYAVDFTGDGKRDIWAPDALDALASAANYLAKFGWTRGAPAVAEVTLPAGFDFARADGATRMSTADWQASGVQGVNGALPAHPAVAILLPAGARGPAFAIYPNFAVIKRYNNATSYALAVAQLASRIQGGPPIQGDWPRGDRTLSRTEKQELQQRLTALGFDTQGIDGIIGPNSRSAVRAFQIRYGLIPDGYVSAALLAQVRKAGS